MKVDKFGLGCLLIGLLVLVSVLHFGFMGGAWTVQGVVDAAVTAFVGGVLIAALLMVAIGAMLLLL